MAEWDDVFKSSVFDESSDRVCLFKSLTSLDDSLIGGDVPAHGYASNFDASWEDFSVYDKLENVVETTEPASLACLPALSSVRVPPTCTGALRSNVLCSEGQWEAYSTDDFVGRVGLLPEEQSVGIQTLGQELALWFGNLKKLPKLSSSTSFSPSTARHSIRTSGAVVDDTASDSGTVDTSSPQPVPANRSGSFNWPSSRSTSSMSSIDNGENEIKVPSDFQPAAAARQGRRKSSTKCSHTKHYAQAERTRAANRAAAHRYREKRRAATNALEERVKELEAEKRSLNATIGTLHAALLGLSEEVSRHSARGGCAKCLVPG